MMGVGGIQDLVSKLIADILKKTVIHLICIAACNLFKCNHHYLTEEAPKVRKMLEGGGCSTYIKAMGIKLEKERDLACMIRSFILSG
eukprot:2413069-Amphidinium_carterae.1